MKQITGLTRAEAFATNPRVRFKQYDAANASARLSLLFLKIKSTHRWVLEVKWSRIFWPRT